MVLENRPPIGRNQASLKFFKGYTFIKARPTFTGFQRAESRPSHEEKSARGHCRALQTGICHTLSNISTLKSCHLRNIATVSHFRLAFYLKVSLIKSVCFVVACIL